MHIRSITITRDGDYGYGAVDASKPFTAKIKVVGRSSEMEIALDNAMSQRVLDLIAEEVAKAGREVANAMTAEVFQAVALPAPEAPVADDEIPL